jgi:hypothetical protein
VVLSVELPADSLDYAEFERALNALSWYADEHYLNVLNLAQTLGAPRSTSRPGRCSVAEEAAAGGTSGGRLDWARKPRRRVPAPSRPAAQPAQPAQPGPGGAACTPSTPGTAAGPAERLTRSRPRLTIA